MNGLRSCLQLVSSCLKPKEPCGEFVFQFDPSSLCSSQFHVFELMRPIPRFAMYAIADPNMPEPKGSVTFHINERINRV